LTYVSLVGEDTKTSHIVGSVAFATASGITLFDCYNRIKNCKVKNLVGKSNTVVIDNVDLENANQSGTSGIIAINNCEIEGGIFTSCTDVCELNNTLIEGGKYPSNLVVNGGTLDKCRLSG